LDIAVADTAAEPAARLRRGGLALGRIQPWLLVAPMLLFFAVFFVVPVLSMFAISLDRPASGSVAAKGDFTLVNFIRFFTTPVYYESVFRTVAISVVSSLGAAALGYPLAYLIAKTEHPGRDTRC
jgi:putative spermidine/putrescine transport system permease protein